MEESKPSYELKNYEILIFGKYILDARYYIGKGSSGTVYSGKILNTDIPIAIKLEKKNYYSYSYLANEAKIYKILEGVENIPKIISHGSQGNYNCLIMDLLGNSLEYYMNYLKKPFSLGTTLKIIIQVLNIIKQIHQKGVILRYIKPANIVMGKGINKDNVYLIDFGLSKRYIKNGKHISYREDKIVQGNIKFISVNAQCGNEISRRDDIECLGYNIVNFMKGKLPWSNLHKDEIEDKKKNTSLDKLCEGLPEEFKEFIKYGKNLKFEEDPNYDYLNGLLMKVAKKNEINIDLIKYDWVIYAENNKKKKMK